MKQDFMKTLAIIALFAVLGCLVVALIGAIGAMKVSEGCLMRYNEDDEGAETASASKISKTVILKAQANYTLVSNIDAQGNLNSSWDPDHYGEWLNTNLDVSSNQKINLTIKGEVSLCRAYIPSNNLQAATNLDTLGNKIAIPRVEEVNVEPISLILDAKTDEWRNIAEIFPNDKLLVGIHKNRKGTGASDAKLYNYFSKNTVNADCSEDKTSYSPICGRYAFYNGNYNKCELVTHGCQETTRNVRSHADTGATPPNGYPSNYYESTSPSSCNSGLPNSECRCSTHCFTNVAGSSEVEVLAGSDDCTAADIQVRECTNRYDCWQAVTAQAPAPYKFDDSNSMSWSNNVSTFVQEYNYQCLENHHQPDVKFWLSADTAAGLLYRLDNSETPADAKSRGNSYSVATILTLPTSVKTDDIYNIIYNSTAAGSDTKYLQYLLYSKDNQFSGNTGGYVLNIKQTKCRRINGSAFSDKSVNMRGQIQYIISSSNPNKNAPDSSKILTLNPDSNGITNLTAGALDSGTLWMKIKNSTEDYVNSTGQYSVHFQTSKSVGSFLALVLNPLFENLKNKVTDASQTIFQNMTCYGDESKTNCTNFFNYIRAMLTLYIMMYGAMFLLGVVQISQTDLVTRVVKIAIVAGLINEKTFEFFNLYIFDFVTNFSDQIISNIAGYSLFSSGTVSNPFMFLDAVMTKVFFSPTFMGQILAFIPMGISGILYFILVFIALIIVIITVLRALAVYIMAFVLIAVLIGIAPLFLTFLLFDYTRYLFDNWVKLTFRYMIEPTVLLAGMIILTQLFTIYLDYVTGYSVCWKCALPIKMPFSNIPNFDFAFTNVDLFCINWFVPYGLDIRSGMMGINMQHLIALVMISYCMYGYTDLSSEMVAKLVGGPDAPSATSIGSNLSGRYEDKAMGSVGLDAKSREKIGIGLENRAKQRLTQKLVENKDGKDKN